MTQSALTRMQTSQRLSLAAVFKDAWSTVLSRNSWFGLGALALVCSLGVGSFAQAQVPYRWIDAEGRVNFSDRPPPPDAREVQELRVLGAGSAGPLAGFSTQTRRAALVSPLVLYTQLRCPPCDLARTWLNDTGLPYEERVLLIEEDLLMFRSQFGQQAQLPTLGVGRGNAQQGFSVEQWSAAIATAGYPSREQRPAGYAPVQRSITGAEVRLDDVMQQSTAEQAAPDAGPAASGASSTSGAPAAEESGTASGGPSQ